MRKKQATINPNCCEESAIVYVALGSNMQQPIEQIEKAFEALGSVSLSRLVAKSSLYQSKPMGPQDQSDYINAVAKLETRLTPISLLDALQDIENSQGRVRKKQQWGPRTLDLDLLLYGNQTITSERLTIPHYDMNQRAFVLIPLAEIEPNLLLANNCRIGQQLLSLTSKGIHKL